MSFILILFLVVVVFSFYIYFFEYNRQRKLGMDTIKCFTGAPGSGKTKIAVDKSLIAYRKRIWMYIFGFIKTRPLYYATIPVVIKTGLLQRFILRIFKHVKLSKFEYANILTDNHLLLQDRIAEYSVILIDEIGEFASQYSYDNPLILDYVDRLFRFCRHYLDPEIFITDQTTSNVVVSIRRRINTVYNLSNFKRVFAFFYKVTCEEVRLAEDVLSFKDVNQEEQPYFFGHLPFKYFKFLDITRLFTYKKYDSRCFSPLFDDIKNVDLLNQFEQLKTVYHINIPNNDNLKKLYKKQGYISVEDLHNFLSINKQKK